MNTAITYNDLPPVEREIADLYVGGLTMKEIAYKRDRSINTVKNQIKKLFEKTEVRKDTEFSVWYFCTRFHLTFDLPQVKKVVATALFLGLFTISYLDETDIMRGSRCRVRTEVRTSRRRNEN